ncbi:ATP-dependent DNA helicase [Entomoplasma ellychniae]|uniref:DNA 3'-5' helicase n=1 Tax=Entomoplasma ellychniae TaxID=2114 RepID=A0A8E2QYA7_9MOLU|nr:UvrD-helicase domain-containing protein [Entomoplasma ellychniae]PPE04669.1 ATP-dependent DNA helicase [Entomoplasma ellychniae]
MIENLLDELNEKQKLAVTTINNPLRIIAGAGSGKTKVITSKIAYLILEKQVAPWKILAVTFTNKAANEMKERVKKLIPDMNYAPQISTFHAWCSRVLREENENIDLPKNFLIIDQYDQILIIKSIIKEFFSENINLRKNMERKIIYRIANWKNDLLEPYEAMDECYSTTERAIAEIYGKYQEHLKEMKSIDFNDLQILTYKLFNNHPVILQKWKDRYDYVMVDEFQDTNDLQFDLIKFITQNKNNLTVVGDPDQTIYSWRGAKVDIILNFNKTFPNGVSITLDQNYRSTQNILDLSNDFINNNKNREAKEIFTKNGNGELPVLKECTSKQNEAEFVAQKIKQLIKDEGYNFQDFYILYRMNAWSQEFEKELYNNRIPFQLIGGMRFRDRKVIKDANAFLRAISTGDTASIERVLKSIPKIGDVTIEKVKSLAESMGISLNDLILKEDVALLENISKHLPIIKSTLIKGIEIFKQENSIRASLQYMLVEIGYIKKLKDTNKNEDIDYIDALYDQLENFDKIYDPKDYENTDKIVSYLQEESLLNSEIDELEVNKVTLLTVHSAKGLENKVVFIVGLNQDIFPGRLSSNSQKEIEEERRALYVALTRAKERLFITYVKGDFSFISQSELLPSKFVRELDEDMYTFEGKFQNKLNPFIKSKNYNSSNLNDSVASKFSKGDIIEHMIFGDGVVIEENQGKMKVAFSSDFGIMPISASDAAITKK